MDEIDEEIRNGRLIETGVGGIEEGEGGESEHEVHLVQRDGGMVPTPCLPASLSAPIFGGVGERGKGGGLGPQESLSSQQSWSAGSAHPAPPGLSLALLPQCLHRPDRKDARESRERTPFRHLAAPHAQHALPPPLLSSPPPAPVILPTNLPFRTTSSTVSIMAWLTLLTSSPTLLLHPPPHQSQTASVWLPPTS